MLTTNSLIAAPYGIREAVERIGTAKINPVIEEHQVETHIPSKVVYELWQLFKDLLTFSVKHLKQNGRVVFWFPIFRYFLLLYYFAADL